MINYPTDKFINKLIPEYERIFAELKDANLKILEIGILNGGFLMWLADYFKKAEIIGADIIIPTNKDEILKYSDRISIDSVDQRDEGSLKNIGKIYGFFDIIIDDGCHQRAETQRTFEALWPFIKPGGLYIIEDFIAGYWTALPIYDGIQEVVAMIMTRKNDWKISDFEIILKEPKCSIAAFKKYAQ